MSDQQKDSVISGMRWVLNLCILAIAFFIQNQVKGIDNNLSDHESRIRTLEITQSQTVFNQTAILEKLQILIDQQKQWTEDISQFYYENSDLKKPNSGK